MSDSRLEKFIYAICSMDVSDLPVPLSRIETLWNCLITGETPDFEPLSRNEKYLMAMLDRYDISNLPAPMSRGEKLLYKIAVGETDLSDVPGYLSRYEELLKYLIENGGISGGDFEYVLYTLNQSLYTLYTTAEKPVKSAILKGQTLVNLATRKTIDYTASTDWDGYNELVQYSLGEWESWRTLFDLKPNTKYYISCYVETFESASTTNYLVNNASSHSIFPDKMSINGVGRYQWVSTSKSTIEGKVKVAIRCQNERARGKIKIKDFMLIEYIDGMENWDIPYFEGMQSVKMPVLTTTGKNLTSSIKHTERYNKGYLLSDKIKVKKGERYQASFRLKCNDTTGEYRVFFRNYNTVDTYINGTLITPTNEYTTYNLSITTQSDGYICLWSLKNNDMFDVDYIQIEQGTVATPYEPYKSNILTVNEPVELRGIGEVRDTLDCLTGELTERIGEIVLDGSKVYYPGGNSNDNYLEFIVRMNNAKRASALCDKVFTPSGGHQNNTEYVRVTESGIIGYILKTRLSTPDVDGLKAWLSSNNVTVQYQLATPITKSIDISTVDQDNQPTQLGTFENITHVSLEAENLIPEVEMEVATNLLEDTVFNLTNAFNTLYSTAAKPVVDGTLYGQTLLSVSNYTFLTGKYLDINNGTCIDDSTNHRYIEDYFVIPEGTQVITLKGVNNYKKICYYDGNKRFIIGYNLSTQNPDDFATNVPTGASYFRFNTSLTEILGSSIVVDEYLHVYVDDYLYLTNKPNYMDGAKLISCKMPDLTIVGKNLINNTSWESGRIDNTTGEVSDDVNFMRYIKYIQVKPSTTYVWKNNVSNEYKAIYEYGASKEYIGLYNNTAFINQAVEFTTSATTNFIKIWVKNTTVSSTNQLEESASATDYEPYKSTTLSTPSDLELRKVGEVQDELNVVTGELTERIGEVVFDGSENWILNGTKTNTNVFRLPYSKLIHDDNRILCDKLPVAASGDVEKIASSGDAGSSGYQAFYVALLKTKANTLSDFKSYLSQNPLTVQYELATPTTKTVDLSVVDQDDNETKLRTFDDTTHVLLESEGLIPTASLTVRTKIPSASSTSLLMDDISTEQQQLETTVDEQSENVDATMIATTEIFEETL